MSKLVTIYGGSGFIGRLIARRMAKLGWRVRVAVRRPNEALFVKPYGVPGQVEPVLCNIRDDGSVRAAMRGADAVVNCVGTFDRGGKNNFAAVQAEGAGRIARIAADEGVAHLVQLSAIGADPEADSLYSRSKGKGEQAVLAAFPAAVILRPSVVFGPGDGLFNRFGGMVAALPVILLPHAATKFQPVYADDVALAAVKGATGEAAPGIYELGGSDVMTLRGIVQETARQAMRRRLILGIPEWPMRIVAALLDFGSVLTGRLFPNKIMTRDQLTQLRHDNVVAPGAKGLPDLGIDPMAVDVVLPEYLWRYRPSGQFAAIKDSARNLKKA
ncbi:MAG: complex I NDUFA9 subunit family protein [Rhodobacteraceae bacterium]|jgi:uncharacterized protein YbjT (DUF2867 family)|nr:complex I NDUFA9 subunit family protein [Paracoccaceae bacterium]